MSRVVRGERRSMSRPARGEGRRSRRRGAARRTGRSGAPCRAAGTGRGHGDHRERRDAQERGQEPVGVVVPGGGPGNVEDVPEFANPVSVRRAHADGFFAGEQVVCAEPFWACRGAVGVEDTVDVEQQGGARHLSSMDAACRGRAGPHADSTTASRIGTHSRRREAAERGGDSTLALWICGHQAQTENRR
jgi:hypothetical protein